MWVLTKYFTAHLPNAKIFSRHTHTHFAGDSLAALCRKASSPLQYMLVDELSHALLLPSAQQDGNTAQTRFRARQGSVGSCSVPGQSAGADSLLSGFLQMVGGAH